MIDWIYCVTAVQVAEAKTQLLLRRYQAVWCLPPSIVPRLREVPLPGDRLWLLWGKRIVGAAMHLLGGGRVQEAPQQLFGTRVLWSGPELPNTSQDATLFGIIGGPAMTYFRLHPVVLPSADLLLPLTSLGLLTVGLNEAAAEQVSLLSDVLPVP